MSFAMSRLRIALLIVLFAGAVAFGAGMGYQKEAEAIPFLMIGGGSFITSFCNDLSFVITVIGPKPGVFKVTWYSLIYRYHQFEFSWVVGKAWPGGICCAGKICFPVMGTVFMIGTSLI